MATQSLKSNVGKQYWVEVGIQKPTIQNPDFLKVGFWMLINKIAA